MTRRPALARPITTYGAPTSANPRAADRVSARVPLFLNGNACAAAFYTRRHSRLRRDSRSDGNQQILRYVFGVPASHKDLNILHNPTLRRANMSAVQRAFLNSCGFCGIIILGRLSYLRSAPTNHNYASPAPSQTRLLAAFASWVRAAVIRRTSAVHNIEDRRMPPLSHQVEMP